MTIHQTLVAQAAGPAEQRFIDLYARGANELPGANLAQVRAWRQSALDRFTALGVPHRRVEEWKYTDLRSLMPAPNPLAGLAKTGATGADIEAIVGKSLWDLDAYRAVFVDGVFRADLSSAARAPHVTLSSLRDALGTEGEGARSITALPLPERDVIAALSTAFATDGVILSVAPGTQLDKPLHLIFAATGGTPAMTVTQNLINLGEGSKVTLIESHAALGSVQSVNFTRLSISANAEVKHARVALGGEATQLSSYAIELGEGAQYDPLQLSVDGALTRAQANIRFAGEGARCHYTGAMMLRGHSHADFTLVVDHAAPGCESRELVKAVLAERARGVFQGKVIVERGAQKTDGKQMANALLLSDDAEFDSKPELEIYADDVACGHGATAGQLDEDLLFYLRARGIREDEARALLIAAFIGEALDKIEDEALREALQEQVDAWLSR
jgi:Fe-S cluster assembly protein SufD